MVNRSVLDGRKPPHALSRAGAAGGLDRGRCVVSTLHLKFSEKAAVSENTDLLNHLRGQRAHLIDKMTNAHQRGGDVSGWLPLLAQTQAAIEAVASEHSEAAMRESLTPG